MDKTLVELTRAREIGRLPVSGSAYSTKRAAIKTGFGLCLIGGAGALVYWAFNSGISNDTLGTFIFLGIFALCFGLVLPQGRAAYVDVQRREVVKEWWYAFFCSRTVTPIAHYSRIVVRHVCHPGGEAEDTFTGSVGLKPLGGGAVVWVKEFPANKDEMTAEPDQSPKSWRNLSDFPTPNPSSVFPAPRSRFITIEQGSLSTQAFCGGCFFILVQSRGGAFNRAP